MVTSTTDAIAVGRDAGEVTRSGVDRWIFVFMAALFVGTALVGFIPTSLAKIAAVQAGQRPPFPVVMHVHVALMASWLLLLLVQSTLVATGRRAVHQTLGFAALMLVPGIVVASLVLVRTTFLWRWNDLAPAMEPVAEQAFRTIAASIVLEATRDLIVFATLVGWALVVRRKDPTTHKRLMYLGTVFPLLAAITRIDGLPNFGGQSLIAVDLMALVWISPMLVYDLVRSGRLHRAYMIWLALVVPLTAIQYSLWGSPWWIATAPRWLGATN